MNRKNKITDLVEKLFVSNNDYSSFSLSDKWQEKIKGESFIDEVISYLNLEMFNISEKQQQWAAVLLLHLCGLRYRKFKGSRKFREFRGFSIQNFTLRLNLSIKDHIDIDAAIEVLLVHEVLTGAQLTYGIKQDYVLRFIEGLPLPELSKDMIAARRYNVKLEKFNLLNYGLLTASFNKVTKDYASNGDTYAIKVLDEMTEIKGDARCLMIFLLSHYQSQPDRYYGFNDIVLNLSGLRKQREKQLLAIKELSELGILSSRKIPNNLDILVITITKPVLEKLGFVLNESDIDLDLNIEEEVNEGQENFGHKSINENDEYSSTEYEFLNYISNNKLESETLFYNKGLLEELDFYYKLLDKDDFDFKKNKLLKGKVVLMFEGAPGTGKTAAAMQLARKTGRGAAHVDWHTIDHKHVGQSEKRLKKLLDEIEDISHEKKRCPIVVFNEAEAFLSKRTKASRHVDKMNNTMVSMLLEWLEKRDSFGIVVFTANYVSMLDKAFERRISRVKFDLPSRQTRLKIWQHLLQENNLSIDVSEFVEYKLSGAEIFKNLRSYSLYKFAYDMKDEDTEFLHKLCNNTKWVDKRPKVGFRA